jgi:hypothetical protein
MPKDGSMATTIILPPISDMLPQPIEVMRSNQLQHPIMSITDQLLLVDSHSTRIIILPIPVQLSAPVPPQVNIRKNKPDGRGKHKHSIYTRWTCDKHDYLYKQFMKHSSENGAVTLTALNTITSNFNAKYNTNLSCKLIQSRLYRVGRNRNVRITMRSEY